MAEEFLHRDTNDIKVCDVCKRERIADKISIHIANTSDAAAEQGLHGIRYCNDNSDCIHKAKEKHP